MRHIGGTYYLRAKVNGKVIRESLKTNDLRIAKLKRDARLAALRSSGSLGAVRTVGEALEVARQRMLGPHLKESSRQYSEQVLGVLEETLPVERQCKSWSEAECREWWKVIGERFSPYRANAILAACRKVAKVVVESGGRVDPTTGLRRMKVVEKDKVIPSRGQMDEIIADIKAQGKRCSVHTADMVAFLAFSGLRVAECRAVEWEHIGSKWLTVTGGEEGTKNRRVRRVPISGPLREVVKRMRYPDAAGPVFALHSPRFALRSAGKRAGLEGMKVHDLRHFFVSWCLMSGTDIATLSRWVGHSDGGALLLRTYGHLLDSHSLDAAERLK